MTTAIPGLILTDGEEETITMTGFVGVFSIPKSHLKGNCRSVKDFEKVTTVHDGRFCIIYECKEKRTGQVYALKKYKLEPDSYALSKYALGEINILMPISHENIVNSHKMAVGSELNRNYLLLDYCNSSLRELIRKHSSKSKWFSKNVVKTIMRQLFQALEFLHNNLIIHRNVNPRSILFTSAGTLKLGCFQSALKFSNPDVVMDPDFTEVIYRAPEILLQKKHYGSPVDMWSAACVFSYLLLEKPLFCASSGAPEKLSPIKVLQSIFQLLGTPSEAIWPGFNEMFASFDGGKKVITNQLPYACLTSKLRAESTSVKELLPKLIVYCPETRMSATDVLKSSYFSDSTYASREEMAFLITGKLSPEPMEIEDD